MRRVMGKHSTFLHSGGSGRGDCSIGCLICPFLSNSGTIKYKKCLLRQHFKSSENFNFDLCIQNNVVQISLHKLPISTLGGCCCRVDNLQHSKSLVISPLWVRASIGSYVRKNSSSACGWSGVFSRGFPIFTPPYD